MSEITVDSLTSPAVLFPLIAAVLGVVIGLCIKLRRVNHLETDGASADIAEIRDLRKTIHLIQTESQKLSIFLMNLPDLARQLNSNTEKRKIPWLLVKFVEQLFDAQQIIIFLTTKDKEHLAIAAAKGLPDAHREILKIGEGRAGWVAQQQIAMDERDFASQVHVGVKAELHPTFRTELCAPMVSNDQTLGVISVGGLLRRPKNEKNMLKMVADLGSISIQNNNMFHRIQNSANIDGLTSLHNKRYFMNKLAEELHRAGNDQGSVSLFIFDIDHFKQYNDTNGHVAGDEALKIAGRLLKENVREDDLPARYGGEEFIVMLPGADKSGAMAVAEKIRSVIENHPFPNEHLQKVTISGGVSTFPYDAGDSSNLIRCADQALYEGKRSGRNKIFAYTPTYFSDRQADGFQAGGSEDGAQCDTVKG